MSRLTSYLGAAVVLGEGFGGRAALAWRLSKNLRVRLGLARYHPTTVHRLRTRWGPVHVRDNFGDVINLPDLWVANDYRLGALSVPGAVLDVGANIGLFAMWARVHNPDRPIHCFEPLAANRALIALNCPSAVVAPVGLGRGPGRVTLRVDEQAIMASRVPTAWPTHEETFEVVALDDYAAAHGLEAVAFLKIDTEGMELDVLDGAAATLGRTARVALETHGEERHRGALERLRAAGLAIEAESRDGPTGLVIASRR